MTAVLGHKSIRVTVGGYGESHVPKAPSVRGTVHMSGTFTRIGEAK